MDTYQPGRATLIAYFEGTITDASTRAAVEAYIAADTHPLLVQACMQTAWENTRNIVVTPAAPADWDKFRMIAGIREHRRKSVWPALVVAATLLLLVSSVLLYYIHRRPQTTPVAWTEIAAAAQELRTVHLQDGTKLTLFPGAKIRYNNQYNHTTRALQLTGRAYFEVATVAGKPFTVATGQYTTQVLGTSFEIAEKPHQHELKVVLVSGKVRLMDAQQQVLSDLQPDQQITIRTDNAAYHVLKVDAGSLVSWTAGRLSYDQATLEEVCTELEKWYGQQIIIHRAALEKKRVTADFEHMPLSAVMDILSETAGFTYKEVNGHIEVY
ncbi:FecR family protein [Chitinophaga rhizophila]|uniref:FecR family protein n=1 Tax=Chitinophaga rhizophila TaxID=2866212 RepID=A0ABS7GKS1_9BACT|nr:FecR family protein [Chitinophaga rhizophila]MBW8688308.1 FecR family protein [Chitinophaga rhizophila]